MSSTYLSLHYHLVFSTKNRAPSIAESWMPALHDYLGGTVRGLGGFSQGVGGIADHVHLLVGLKATHCLADFMRELKKAGSIWVHEEIGQREFAWQEGYAAFTVGAPSRAAVKHYIAHQAEHHRSRPFRDELLEMLHKAESNSMSDTSISPLAPLAGCNVRIAKSPGAALRLPPANGCEPYGFGAGSKTTRRRVARPICRQAFGVRRTFTVSRCWTLTQP